MASKNVAGGKVLFGVVTALSVPFLAIGCGGDNPPTRPDAYVATTPDAFAPMVDAGPVPDVGRDTGGGPRVCRSPTGECDLLMQDCPMGETCVFARPDAMATESITVCAPIVGAGAEEGGACCALNSCDTGLFCAGAVETMPGTCTSMGRCTRYCCGSSADCSPGETCAGFGGGFMGGQCDTIDGCDLVQQTGCESMPGTSCYPGMGATTQCVASTAAMADEGETCMFTNDCVPGAACFTVTPGGGGMARSVCLRFCDVGDGAMDCPNSMGMACQTAGDLPAGTGVCPPAA